MGATNYLLSGMILQVVNISKLVPNIFPPQQFPYKVGPYDRYKWSHGAPTNRLINEYLRLFHPYKWSLGTT